MDNDTIHGGSGVDLAIYQGERSEYIIIPPELLQILPIKS